ncbi:MAG: hypothetical protein WA063_03550, partial [Minisyncoccia bacterium]
MAKSETKKEATSVIFSKIVLGVCVLVSLIVVASIIFYLYTKKSDAGKFLPGAKQIKSVEFSSDARSILDSKTKQVIFTIEDANKYLKDSGYAYDPDTFQDTNAKYVGDCFLDAALSNKKDRIVFSTGCLAGDLLQAWIGVYNFSYKSKTDLEQVPKIYFLTGGSGRNFVWSVDDKTITYEADLGLSGLTETRTIDAATGKIIESKINSENEEEVSLKGVSKLIYEAYKNSLGADYDLSSVIESIKNDELFFTDMIENPYDNTKLAITIKYKDYSRPHGVLIIDSDKEILKNQYIFIGALEHLYIENVKWENVNELSFNSVVIDEGGINKRSKILKVDETADWQTYRNEEYEFEFKYPSYAAITTKDKNISLNLNFGSELKDAANSWSVNIAEIKNYGVYSYDDGYIIYDIINNKWYTTNQFTLGKFDANKAEKIEEYSPEIVAKTYDGNSVFGKDFYYYDVGYGSLWYPIIYKDKNLIIEFSRSIDENGKDQIVEGLLSGFNSEQDLERERLREKINKEMEETQNKIDKDFNQVFSTFKFTEKDET